MKDLTLTAQTCEAILYVGDQRGWALRDKVPQTEEAFAFFADSKRGAPYLCLNEKGVAAYHLLQYE